jgi:gas vesicle protein
MSTFEKNMEQIFDVTPTKIESAPVVIPAKNELSVNSDLSGDLNDAYEQTKANLQELIDQGKEAMQDILQIAKDGQHPRAFEVYGTLLKNVVEANKELLAVQKQMREMDKNSSSGGTQIDNAIFVGSTSELNKLIKGMK